MIRLFIRDVEEELMEEEIDAFLPVPEVQRRPDGPTTPLSPLSPLSPDDINKLFERQLSASHRKGSARDSLSEGKFEPFKLNDRVSRRSRGSARRGSLRKSGLEVEAEVRKEEEEKKRREEGGY